MWVTLDQPMLVLASQDQSSRQPWTSRCCCWHPRSRQSKQPWTSSCRCWRPRISQFRQPWTSWCCCRRPRTSNPGPVSFGNPRPVSPGNPGPVSPGNHGPLSVGVGILGPVSRSTMPVRFLVPQAVPAGFTGQVFAHVPTAVVNTKQVSIINMEIKLGQAINI